MKKILYSLKHSWNIKQEQTIWFIVDIVITILVIANIVALIWVGTGVYKLHKLKSQVEDQKEKIVEQQTTSLKNKISYYDVPLDNDLQDYIFKKCEYKNIDPSIIIAMIERESSYNPNTIGDNGDSFGLMQIQPKWHKERMNKLGVTNLLDPYQNINVGIDYMTELLSYGNGSLEWALMAYNGGYTYADNNLANGIISDYATDICMIRNMLKTK